MSELLAYEDAPARMSTTERLTSLALVGPWLACATGWAYFVTAHEIWRWIRR